MCDDMCLSVFNVMYDKEINSTKKYIIHKLSYLSLLLVRDMNIVN